MKKVFVIALFAFALFAFSASAEVIEFPSVKITLDVEEGWEYSDNGTGCAEIEGPDGSVASITRFGPQGASLDDFVKVLVKEQKGTKPKKEGKAYIFACNGGKTTVIVSQDDTTSNDFVVMEITAKSQKSLDIINKILSSAKDI